MRWLPESFFQGEDPVAIARDLIGARLEVEDEQGMRAGLITETEAYRSWGDRACHAHANRQTARNRVMFEEGGRVYVYLCYGIHVLFNIVTHRAGTGEAVLIRAIEPLVGTEAMLAARKMTAVKPALTGGPGRVSQALGVGMADYGARINDSRIRIAPPEASVKTVSGPRIGVDYAGEDAALPWRFGLAGSRWVSKPFLKS